ncbi:unnamed protein product [Tilletia controversa]|uniref:RRM domain-containing protein n=2 Tax=Tilletia TaxID=13289 RepID=A0A8X7MZR8_9BASI|nr:hypothetical protein CF336_g2461 [Tilletia laevis]KAE8204421.1 hypothetical protein CF328_g1098 [Tilletia controversa]CAD6897763.1 unnamed protein product [Tilletia caries]KAE8256055.1 hypothetical protein A4X06_0g109 [Tilletia controversa]CAD6932101.1 unnamed protein product [Tilletia controversa]
MAQQGSSASYGAGSDSTDPYAPFYYWDASTSQWAFDYQSYYKTYGSYPPGTDTSGYASSSAGGGYSGGHQRSGGYGGMGGGGSGGYGAGSSGGMASMAGTAGDSGGYGYASAAPGDASAYNPVSSAYASGSAGPSAEGSGGVGPDRRPKKGAGAKDAEGNPIAGNLKRGETRMTIIRKAAGKVWEDPSLLDWDPSHKQLFVGDLGNDVTDEILKKAFEKYPTFAKAKVVRKKADDKSKGYGFVSFADPEDFLKAWKEMDGKYVGSRPIRLKKAEVNVRPIVIGARKDKFLAANAKHEEALLKRKMGGAVGSTLRRQGGAGKPYGT